MRRPLCLICAAFVVSVFFCLQRMPLSSVSDINLDTETEGSSVIYAGEVYDKEYRQDSLILYLKNISQKDIQVSPTVKLPKDSNSIGLLCFLKNPEKEPKLGSRVIVSGKVSFFGRPRNPGGFDEEGYYRIRGIGFALKEAKLQKESLDYSKYHEGLYCLRRHLEKSFAQVMSEKDASIMKAMVLGNKEELDRDSKQLYRQSGISHILAISGLHITLLGMGLYRLLHRLRLPVLLSSATAVCLMVMYGDMVGMSSSAYRAVFMFALAMGAKVLHRTYDMMTALAMAAVGILLEQPLYIYHEGFLLSFGAIIGIGCIREILETDTKQIGRNKIKEGLLGSGSIFLVHFPILLSFSYEFPVYSFLLNLMIIPAMTVVMGLGLLCMTAGSIGMGAVGAGISKAAAAGCHMLLVFFEKLCEGAMMMPGASWLVGKPKTWRMVVFYAAVLLLFLQHKYCKYAAKGKLCLSFPLKMIGILLAVVLITQKSYYGLSLTILDVGQGDGIWLETERGHHYLIDGGSSSERKLCEYTLVPFLKQTGTETIEAVFLTHLDRDHISGVMELLDQKDGIKIRSVVISQAAIRDETYWELSEKCREKEIPLRYVKAGDKFCDGRLALTVLHPSADYAADSNNAYSMVLKLEYGGFHALFTGDVEADGEAFAAKELPKDWTCHLYKASHHGSKTSNTEELVSQLAPQLTVISCGENNSYGHPHAETLERLEKAGSRIRITKDTGAIMLHYSPFSDIIEENQSRKKGQDLH